MICFETGKNNRPLRDIALDFVRKLENRIIDSGGNRPFLEKTVFRNIEEKLTNSQIERKKQKFLQIFAANDFKFLRNTITLPPQRFENVAKLLDKQNKDLGLPEFGTREGLAWKDELIEIFGYPYFDKTIGREWLIDALDMKVCPYCNLHHLSVVSNSQGDGKIVLMDIDHFYRKARYPYFSMSFHNLIPSCSNCNGRLKGQEPTTLKTHLHPYSDSLHANSVFDKEILIIKGPDNPTLRLRACDIADQPRTDNTIRLFRLEDQYKSFGLEAWRIYQNWTLQDKEKLRRYEQFALDKNGSLSFDSGDEETYQYYRVQELPATEKQIGRIRLGKLKWDLTRPPST